MSSVRKHSDELSRAGGKSEIIETQADIACASIAPTRAGPISARSIAATNCTRNYGFYAAPGPGNIAAAQQQQRQREEVQVVCARESLDPLMPALSRLRVPRKHVVRKELGAKLHLVRGTRDAALGGLTATRRVY